MNKTQRQNTSKLLYEIVKIIFSGVVVSVFLPGKFNLSTLLSGILACLIMYIAAYYFDSEENVS